MLKSLNNFFQRKLVKDSFALYAGRGINLFVGLVSTLLYGMIFLNTQIAVISLFEMVANLFLSFGFTWSSLGIVRFGREEYINRKTVNYNSSIRLGIIFPLLILSTLAILILGDSFLAFIGTNDKSIVTYLILNIVLLVSHGHITSILTTAEKHFSNTLFFLGQSISKICILFIFYCAFLPPTAELYLKINVYLLFILLFIRMLSIQTRLIYPLKLFSKDDYHSFLKFVLPQIYGFAGTYLINWMDTYFIRKYCNLNELGAYQFLYTTFLKISSFAYIMNTLFLPRIVTWKNTDQDTVYSYLRLAPHFMLAAMVFAIGILAIIYSSVFAIFFDDKFTIAYRSYNILLWAIPMFFMTHVFIPVLNSYDKVKYIQAVNVLSALTNLTIDFILIKRYGIIAGALGTFLAYLVTVLLLIAAIVKMFNVKYKSLTIIIIIISICVISYFIKVV